MPARLGVRDAGLSQAHNGGVDDSLDNLVLSARARVLADLVARHQATAAAVSALEDACESRQWWARQWPEGEVYVAGLVAQDVQDALFEKVGRWPMCLACDDGPVHSLYIQPDLGGPDPVWVCEETGQVAAALGTWTDESSSVAMVGRRLVPRWSSSASEERASAYRANPRRAGSTS